MLCFQQVTRTLEDVVCGFIHSAPRSLVDTNMMTAFENVIGAVIFLGGPQVTGLCVDAGTILSSHLLLAKHGTSLGTAWIVIWRRVPAKTRSGFVTLRQRVLHHVHFRRTHGWRFGVWRPFRLGFPKLTRARAGNLRIHRRPCFLHARSNLQRVITLRSRRHRDWPVFDVRFCFCDQNTRPLSRFVRLGQDSRCDEARLRRWICHCDLNVPGCLFVFPSMSPESSHVLLVLHRSVRLGWCDGREDGHMTRYTAHLTQETCGDHTRTDE